MINIEKKKRKILSVTRGVYDPNILKIKTMENTRYLKIYILQLLYRTRQKGLKLQIQGLRVVNSDDVFEKYLKDAKLDFKMIIFANQGKEKRCIKR